MKSHHDDWEKEFRLWKLKKSQRTQNFPPLVLQETKDLSPKELPRLNTGRNWSLLALLIPLCIGVYLLYVQLIASHDFTYFYDIGERNEKYLSPQERISQPGITTTETEDITYRNMTSSLVYFSVPIPRFADTITVQARFNPKAIPKNESISLGARDQEPWHYLWHPLYTKRNDSDENWIIVQTTFNLSQTYLQKNQLSLVFNAPYLSKKEYKNNSLPIDWIESTIHKRGALE